jgi:hypothetical protein
VLAGGPSAEDDDLHYLLSSPFAARKPCAISVGVALST